VVATTRYEDPELRQLRAPARDAEDLAEILGDPDIGAFTVTQVIDADERQVRRAIDVFLSDRGVGDLVVVYLSCHGVLDRRNRLYFAASDTLKMQLGSTGIPAAWLMDELEECRARSKVLILDCCFSGAFAHGSKGDADLDLERRLAGHGRGQAVLTASRAGEYSFEGEALPGAVTAGSVFTAGLVEGLRTGAADVGGDGYVSVDEAFDYAYRYVLSSGASQTPQQWLYGGEGAIVIARSPAGITVTPAPLPEALAAGLDSPHPAIRIGAVNALAELLSGADPGLALAAEQKLCQVADTDVPAVAAAARSFLPSVEPAGTERHEEDFPPEAARTAREEADRRAREQLRTRPEQACSTREAEDEAAAPDQYVALQVSDAQVAVHWREEGYYPPPTTFVAQANANDPAIRKRFTEDKFPDCFKEYADLLTWDQTWHTTLGTGNAPFYKWFTGGKLNASYNCVDRHVGINRNNVALIWVPEPESEKRVVISYRDLYRRINEFAALLRDFCGVKAGDRVTLHMPMVPELPVAMLACARLGAIHSAVFADFSGAACGARLADSGSRVLITMDGYYRAGQMTDHKVKADEALAAAAKEGKEVDKVLVWRRRPGQYASNAAMVDGRDFFVDELLLRYAGQTVEPVPMPAEAPLFLMYTSGTTGRPKGCQHSTGGYLSYVVGTSKYYLDIHPGDVYWCLADIGWITGHSYIVYGPLALGATTVIYEGVPNYPDGGRPWRVAEKLGVNIFHTSPTSIRMLRKVGPDEPAKYDYHFKNMTTVGEPIEPEVWRWYYESVGKGEAAITDTWWQTETGGILGSTLPALEPMKPGSCGPGVLGIYPVIYDENGDEVPRGSGKVGNLCIRNPWPGMCQTIWGQPELFVSTYYAKYNKDPNSKDWHDWPYFAGDGAVQEADGYYRILGRVDVINVAGHRLGTRELESAALTVPEVAEAAAVPVVDDLRGRVVEMYVSLKPGYEPSKEITDKVSKTIETVIGKIARPKNVWIVPDMPKTRSGKIMRRVIASVSNFADVGDVTTLANPEVVEQIRHRVQSAKVAKGEVPRELTEAEKQEMQSFGAE
jgi:acetyl-CoA synthetase